MSKIAVAGATGRVGRHIVDVLEAAGHDVVPISRATGVDVVTGEGLDEALAGVERHRRRRDRADARRAGGDRVLHHRGAQPARRGRGARA